MTITTQYDAMNGKEWSFTLSGDRPIDTVVRDGFKNEAKAIEAGKAICENFGWPYKVERRYYSGILGQVITVPLAE